jgi:phage gpG-like protein
MTTLDLFINDAVTQITDEINGIDETPFSKIVGGILETAIKMQFATEGAYFQRGAPWGALMPSTVFQRSRGGTISRGKHKGENRPKFGGEHPILKRHSGEAGLAGSIHYAVEPNSVIMAAAKAYAEWHQTGTKRMQKRIIFPTEEFGLPPDVIDMIERKYEQFMQKAMK